MARKVTNAPVEELTDEEFNDLFTELQAGTQAHLVSDTANGVLHDRPKIPTPIPHLNCLLGGGVPMSLIIEIFGDPACFTGDTKIIQSNGKLISFSELYYRNAMKIETYNCNNMLTTEKATAERVFLSKYVNDLIKVTINNDYVIRCTEDHPFLLKNGEYRFARDLINGDILKELNLGQNDTDIVIVTDIEKIHEDEAVPVYGLINSGEWHNYPVALTDKLGVFVKNSGKSSTAYQMMGMFQEKYPRGVSIIVDMEASVDSERLPFLGINHPERIMRVPATSIESGFNEVLKILDKKAKNERAKNLPVFIIWDTIGAGSSTKELELGSSAYAEGCFGHAKLLKHQLNKLLPQIEKQPIIVILLNQVSTEQNGKFGTKLGSSGGWGIKHNAHIRMQFRGGGTDKINDLYTVTKNSTLSLIKSKVSPLFDGLSVMIDVREGGKIDPVGSFLNFIRDKLHYVQSAGGFWKFEPTIWTVLIPEYDGKFEFNSNRGNTRWSNISDYAYNNPKFIKALQIAFIKQISSIYKYQGAICKPYMEQLAKEIDTPDYYIDSKNHQIKDSWHDDQVVLEYDPTKEVPEIYMDEVDKVVKYRTVPITKDSIMTDDSLDKEEDTKSVNENPTTVDDSDKSEDDTDNIPSNEEVIDFSEVDLFNSHSSEELEQN